METDYYYIQERLQLIREYYAEGQYYSGIQEGVVVKSNLTSSALKEKFFCNICKLLSLGYRKLQKYQSALSIIEEALLFSNQMKTKTKNTKWIVESATLHVNKGIILECLSNSQDALKEYRIAEYVFQQQKDYYHLSQLYQTIILACLSINMITEAEFYLDKLKNLSICSNLNNINIIEILSDKIKESKNENC